RRSLGPGRRHAGGRFQATLPVSTSDAAAVLAGGRVSCSAKAGRSLMRAAGTLGRVGSLVRASCSWTIPRSARNQVLAGSVKLTAGGRLGSRAFAARVGWRAATGAHLPLEPHLGPAAAPGDPRRTPP